MYFIPTEWILGRHPQIPILKIIGKIKIIPNMNYESRMLAIAVEIIDMSKEYNGIVTLPFVSNDDDLFEEPEKDKYILTFSIIFQDHQHLDECKRRISNKLFPQ